jgi:hypothetical protein
MLGNMTVAVIGSASFGYIACALDTMGLLLCPLPCQGKVWWRLEDQEVYVECAPLRRVDFKTQDESGESSTEAQELVNAAQTIFQQGGKDLIDLRHARAHSRQIWLCTCHVTCPVRS